VDNSAGDKKAQSQNRTWVALSFTAWPHIIGNVYKEFCGVLYWQSQKR